MWTSLQRGDAFIRCRQGVECYKGSIDERTEDGRTIWVTDQIGDCRLFHVEDDYDLVNDRTNPVFHLGHRPRLAELVKTPDSTDRQA